jgi:branched-chain amino acid transport system ATP-binding protein
MSALMALLETRGITVRFGGNTALSDVSIAAEPGVVTALIGPNGAGKTTLFNTITGLLPPSEGQVFLDGNDVTKLAPHKRARRGLARTFQRLELFSSLTVRDNVRVAGEIRNSWDRRHRIKADDEAERIIELVGLSHVADKEVAEIPTGQARLVELGRSLMTKPKVLLLDEPASGQDESETEAFGKLLKKLAHDDGIAVCLVEHDVALVMAVSTTIHVLDFGRIIAVGTPEEIRADKAVLDAYLGAAEDHA